MAQLNFLTFLRVCIVTCWVATIPASAELPSASDLESLQNAVAKHGAANLTFTLRGVVHALDPQAGMVVVEDETATLLLEIPTIPAGLQPGMTLELTSQNCRVTRGAYAIGLGTAPMFDSDGLHTAVAQHVTVTHSAGAHPFRLEWFNGAGDLDLLLEVEGENLARQRVPNRWFRQPTGPGLEYRRYSGERWFQLPNFSNLKPDTTGIVLGLDPAILRGTTNSAVVFSGMIDLPYSGDYRFHLSSDDGSRVFLGESGVIAKIADRLEPSIFPAENGDPWGVTEGVVTFAGNRANHLELDLELAGTVESTTVTVLNPAGADPLDFLGKHVAVTGLRTASRVVALDRRAIVFLTPSGHQPGVLTTAAEVHQLQPEQARRRLPVRLRGVVTAVSPQSIVLQDSSGGVYIHTVGKDAAAMPCASEIWDVSGVTGEGDFSPVVRDIQLTFRQTSELPRGLKPTREQFADGSLDAEQVEIDGIVVSSTPEQLELLTQEGPIVILEDVFYHLPTLHLDAAGHAALSGSVIKLRGVYTATWEQSTRRVTPSRLRLGNAIFSVTSPAPADPFTADLIKASDLLLFNSETRALQRVKVAGTVLLRKQRELFIHDGSSGFRVLTREPSDLVRGDRMEAVGFPRLEATTPVLLEATVRKTGVGALPDPVVPAGDLDDNPKLDSTLVTVQGSVLSDTRMESDRTLELENGPVTFLAHIPPAGNAGASFRKGSQLAVTGVYVKKIPGHGTISAPSFEIETAGPADIRLLHNGPWWTPRRTFILILALCGLLLLISLVATLLQRTVVRRTQEIALHIRERAAIERKSVLDQERSRVAQDLHDELGAGLTEAGILASLAGNPSIPAAGRDGYLKQLGGVCRHLVTGLDEIVWAVNPSYDAVSDLASYFSLFAQQLLQLAGIGCRLHIPASIPAHRLESQVRHGIFLAFKESLNNVVKHSGATVVHLTVEIREGRLFIAVTDDGHGFDPAATDPSGRGLNGMRNRIEQLGGTFHLQTRPGAGTEITFTLPLENP